MTKSEELTEDWKAGKLDVGFYYVKGADGMFGIMSDYALYKVNLSHPDNEITLLAPVPTYDEYKTMQEELTEFKRSVTSYIGKPIDYDIACETVNKLLDDKEQLKKELESARWYQTIQNKDISKLRGLLKECLAHLSLDEIGASVTPINILIDHINATLGGDKIQANPLDCNKIQESEEQ